jgi:hypothetical protein
VVCTNALMIDDGNHACEAPGVWSTHEEHDTADLNIAPLAGFNLIIFRSARCLSVSSWILHLADLTSTEPMISVSVCVREMSMSSLSSSSSQGRMRADGGCEVRCIQFVEQWARQD